MTSQFITRFETAKILGIRSLEIAEGSPCKVHIEDERHRLNYLYVAGIELYAGKLDMKIIRANGTSVHVHDLRIPKSMNRRVGVDLAI